MTDKIVVLSTCETEEEAVRVARHLVEKKLAACVNILPQAHSVYRWAEKSGPDKGKSKIEDTAEFVLIIKSRRDLFDALRVEIGKIHSYEIPEVIALPVVWMVNRPGVDLAWMDRELTSRRSRKPE